MDGLLFRLSHYPVIGIDDQELSWREFGRLLTTYACWGMRIVFVPEDRLDSQPATSPRRRLTSSAATRVSAGPDGHQHARLQSARWRPNGLTLSRRHL